MEKDQWSPESATQEARIERVRELLARYPDIEEADKDEIAAFLTKGEIMDVGRLTGMEELEGPLERFREQERRRLSFRRNDYEIVFMILATIALLTWLIMDSGVGH